MAATISRSFISHTVVESLACGPDLLANWGDDCRYVPERDGEGGGDGAGAGEGDTDGVRECVGAGDGDAEDDMEADAGPGPKPSAAAGAFGEPDGHTRTDERARDRRL